VKIPEVIEIVGNTPHTTHAQGRALYNFVLEHRLTRCLEMGFAHGVGTVWIAAAMQELGGGKVISVDNESAHRRIPSAAELTTKAGLKDYVELHYDESSYNWHLHNNWNEYLDNKFDLIFLDGAHSWEVDAPAFLLGSRVLKQGGWFVFDDLYWSYASSPSLKNTPHVQAMSPLMRDTQQVRSIWEKLVLPDPSFGNFRDDGTRGWAQKIS
jgi:predicted O-methyltransferase YrrM